MASDFYQILGVESAAPLEEIKRRYRLLVRENHPDVAVDKIAAHAKMQEILLAWSTLSDPNRRARYDLDRHQSAHRSAAPTHRQPPAAPTPSAPVSRPAPRPVAKLDPQEEARKRARVQQAMGGGGPTRGSNPRTRTLSMIINAAQLHAEGKNEEAIRDATYVLRADPTNAEAAVLLGDIYAQQDKKSMALSMYERAMRLQPSNLLYRQKMENLRHGEVTAAPAPITRSTAANPWAKPPARQTLADRIAQSANSPSAPIESASSDLPPSAEPPAATDSAPMNAVAENSGNDESVANGEFSVANKANADGATRSSLFQKFGFRRGK